RANEARCGGGENPNRFLRRKKGKKKGGGSRGAVASTTHRRFWDEFKSHPTHLPCLPREKFQLWVRDPCHPSQQFTPLVGNVWSVRIGDHYRAMAQKHGDLVVWFWTGTHEEYNNFVRQRR